MNQFFSMTLTRLLRQKRSQINVRMPPRLCCLSSAGIGLLIVAALAAGCSSGKFQHQIMRAPTIYEAGAIDPLDDDPPANQIVYEGILYATNRMPPDAPSEVEFYSGETDGLVHVGVADVELTNSDLDWEQIRQSSLSKDREVDLTLQIQDVRELGVLSTSRHPFLSEEMHASYPDADAPFAQLINQQLAQSKDQEILVYVHGYRVPFDDPVLVASEFWHFMGYDGVAIPYSWPSTPSLIAYIRDTEAADNASREFRLFLQYLAQNTDAERINILAYSAGTRLVTETLQDLALTANQAPTKLGRVIVVGSDVSRIKVGGLLADGVLERCDELIFYVSFQDMAIGFADWIYDRARIGGFSNETIPTPAARAFLDAHPALQLINVNNAENATRGDGHSYFRSSPWVSSDILASLDFHLDPAQRGLTYDPAAGFWNFPEDYPEKLIAAIRTAMR